VEIAQAETGTARQEHEQEHLFSGAEQPAQSLNGRRLPAAAPPPGAGGELQLRHREHGRLRGRGRAAVAVAEWLRRGPAPLRRRRCRRPREHARAAAAEAHHEHHVPDRHRRRQRLPHRELGLRSCGERPFQARLAIKKEEADISVHCSQVELGASYWLVNWTCWLLQQPCG